MKKIHFISLGCDKNLVDAEYMLGILKDSGFQFTDEAECADIIVVNTCSFINDAKEESIQTILEMAQYKTDGNCKGLIVTGCLAERYREEIFSEIPEVDAVLGTNSYNEIAKAVKDVQKGTKYQQYKALEGIPFADSKRVVTTGGHYAYLKIAEGCNKHCTYCIIPHIRGKYRSIPLEQLVATARELVADGVKELILVAQETTLYGVDLYGKKSLARLLDELNQIQGLFWIRILYCYPEEIDEELIQSIKRNEKVCHYLDLPIQHASDNILKRMGRKTTQQDIRNLIDRLRTEIPDIALRTTVICGFPGETEADHEELMCFINEMEFDRLGAFTYSPEEGTPACGFDNQIEEEQKKLWQQEVMELQEEIMEDMNQTHIGEELFCIIEGQIAGEQTYIGRTYRDVPDVDGYIFIDTDETLMSGDLAKVKVIGAYEYDLIGELL